MAVINLSSVRISPRKDSEGRRYHLLFNGYKMPDNKECSFDFSSREIREKTTCLTTEEKQDLAQQLYNEWHGAIRNKKGT